MFERHLTLRKAGGNHVQVNMVPISREASSRAKAYIEAMGQQIGIRSFEVSGAATCEWLCRMVAKKCSGTIVESIGGREETWPSFYD